MYTDTGSLFTNVGRIAELTMSMYFGFGSLGLGVA